MRRAIAITAVGAIIATAVAGCCLGDIIFPIGGVNVDTSKIGTGEPAFTPRDDLEYYQGEPSNMRRKD